MTDDSVGAFCPHGRFILEGSNSGPLAGLTFAVKDLIDIEGHRTGAGNPRWLDTHAPAGRTAPCVLSLLDAGATMIGKTITDELAYSLHGDNIHYGTPRNANAPGRVPGGSSSGSAAAVAAGLCDFALATDSGGSIRIPASYCGIFGLRTTHGMVSMDGVVPLMPGYDTVGWVARDIALMDKITAVLMADSSGGALNRLIIPTDAIADGDPAVRSAFLSLIELMGPIFLSSSTLRLSGSDGLDAWRADYRLASAAETWDVHGSWIESTRPDFAPAIAERFAFAKTVTSEQAARARKATGLVRTRVRDLLGSDGVLCLPSAPGPAPRLDADAVFVEEFRHRAQRLTCIAGIAGLPQLSVPLMRIDGLPVGFSLIGPARADRALIALADRIITRLAEKE